MFPLNHDTLVNANRLLSPSGIRCDSLAAYRQTKLFADMWRQH